MSLYSIEPGASLVRPEDFLKDPLNPKAVTFSLFDLAFQNKSCCSVETEPLGLEVEITRARL